MENREVLFKKIEAKQREWQSQVKYLQSKATRFDSDTRTRIEEQIAILDTKLKDIEKRTSQVKKTSYEVKDELADKIVHSWIEVFTKIDDDMLKLKE